MGTREGLGPGMVGGWVGLTRARDGWVGGWVGLTRARGHLDVTATKHKYFYYLFSHSAVMTPAYR